MLVRVQNYSMEQTFRRQRSQKQQNYSQNLISKQETDNVSFTRLFPRASAHTEEFAKARKEIVGFCNDIVKTFGLKEQDLKDIAPIASVKDGQGLAYIYMTQGSLPCPHLFDNNSFKSTFICTKRTCNDGNTLVTSFNPFEAPNKQEVKIIIIPKFIMKGEKQARMWNYTILPDGRVRHYTANPETLYITPESQLRDEKESKMLLDYIKENLEVFKGLVADTSK